MLSARTAQRYLPAGASRSRSTQEQQRIEPRRVWVPSYWAAAEKKRWPSISKQKVRLFSNQEAVLAAVYWGA